MSWSADAGAVSVTHEPVAPDQVVAGAPTTGWRELGSAVDGAEVGVWEMSPGTMSDVEADEVFVVIAGRATVRFADGRAPISLVPGSVVRLDAGAETVWTVTETLRKVYVTPAPASRGSTLEGQERGRRELKPHLQVLRD